MTDSLLWEISFGEAWRRKSTQEWLVEKGWSQTMNSDHRNKCAIDVFVWIGGKFITNERKNETLIKPAGDFWKAQHPACYWGGDYRTLVDLNHFGMKRIPDGGLQNGSD